MAEFDRAGIAERLRGLLGGQHNGDVAETAARLGIEELSLRMSIDEHSPHPTVEVLAAVVREFGVDPTWLLTGAYNVSTHRHSMDGLHSITAELRARVEQQPSRISEPTSRRFYIHERN